MSRQSAVVTASGAANTTTILEPIELRARGSAALVDALGWANAVRFLQQFEKSTLDYTAKRDSLLPDLPTADLVRGTAGLSDYTNQV